MNNDEKKKVLQPFTISSVAAVQVKKSVGCMVCGAQLKYLETKREVECSYCGNRFKADAICEQGHFVCDACHSKEAIEIIKQYCLSSNETDMINLLNIIRKHPSVPMHGPEHHFAVPGIIISAYRNSGGDVGAKEILIGIERGKSIPGGACGFWGACGAALGVGIGFGVIIGSSPVKPSLRQHLHKIVQEVLADISSLEAARCCQRETWTALKKAAEISKNLLPISLKANGPTRCTQMKLNKECPEKTCPYYPDCR